MNILIFSLVTHVGFKSRQTCLQGNDKLGLVGQIVEYVIILAELADQGSPATFIKVFLGSINGLNLPDKLNRVCWVKRPIKRLLVVFPSCEFQTKATSAF
jgi:hypothetical protein